MAEPNKPVIQSVDDLAAFRKDEEATAKKNFWKGMGAGTYEAINQALMGLPDFLVKKTSSPTYEKLVNLRAEHPLATKVGGVTGIVGGAAVDAPVKAVQAAGNTAKLVKAGKTAAKLGDAAEAMKNAGALGKALQYSVPEGLIDWGTYGDPKSALERAALSTALGTAGGKLVEKLTPGAIGKASAMADFPAEHNLSKVGISGGDIKQAINIGRKAPVEGPAASGRLTPAEITESFDDIRDAISKTIDKSGFKTPDSFGKFLAEPTSIDDLTKFITDANTVVDKTGAITSTINPNVAQQAALAIKGSAAKGQLGSLQSAARSPEEFMAKMKELGTYGLVGGALGGGTNVLGTLSSGESIDPEELAKSALLGVGGGLALKKGVPLAKTAAAKVVEPLANVAKGGAPAVMKAAKEAGEMAAKIGGASENLMPSEAPEEIAVSETEAEPTPERDLSNWYNKVDELAKMRWKREMLTYNQNIPYDQWFESRYGKNITDWSPEGIARSNTDLLSKEDKDAILKDFQAKKKLEGLDLNFILRTPNLFTDILEKGKELDPNSEAAKKQYQLNDFLSTMLGLKPGQSISTSTMKQFNDDLDYIKRSGKSSAEKQKMFTQLLKDKYGYNPDYLKSLGLGE